MGSREAFRVEHWQKDCKHMVVPILRAQWSSTEVVEVTYDLFARLLTELGWEKNSTLREPSDGA